MNARFLQRLGRPEGELRQVLAEVLAATRGPADPAAQGVPPAVVDRWAPGSR